MLAHPFRFDMARLSLGPPNAFDGGRGTGEIVGWKHFTTRSSSLRMYGDKQGTLRSWWIEGRLSGFGCKIAATRFFTTGE